MSKQVLIAAIAVVAAVASGPAYADLVAHWPLDSIAGGSTPEVVGGANGTVVGEPAVVPGKFGNAIDFDGDGDNLDHAFMMDRAEFTIVHWLRPQNIGSRAGAMGYYESSLAGQNGFESNAAAILEFHSGLARPADFNNTTEYPHLADVPPVPDGTGRWYFAYQDGNAAAFSPNVGDPADRDFNNAIRLIGGTAEEDMWNHIAITKTADDVFTLYENGIAVHTVDAPANSIEFNEIESVIGLNHIGAPGSVETRWWSGLMDDVAIYDTALSPTQIQDIIDNGVRDVAAGVPGDYNNDDTVDAADYTVWRNNLGGVSLPNEGGISPGVVDTADYDFWKSRFGATSGSGSSPAAVPEPAGIMLVAVGLLAIAAYSRKRRGPPVTCHVS